MLTAAPFLLHELSEFIFFLPYESSLPYTRGGSCRCVTFEAKRIANPFPRKRPPETAETMSEWSGHGDIKV